MDWWTIAGLAVVIAVCVLAWSGTLSFVTSVQNLIFYKDNDTEDNDDD